MMSWQVIVMPTSMSQVKGREKPAKPPAKYRWGLRAVAGLVLAVAVALAVDAVLVVQEHLERAVVRLVVGAVQSVRLNRRVGGQNRAATRSSGQAECVHLVRYRSTGVRERNRVAVVVDRSERLVNLDEFTVRQAL